MSRNNIEFAVGELVRLEISLVLNVDTGAYRHKLNEKTASNSTDIGAPSAIKKQEASDAIQAQFSLNGNNETSIQKYNDLVSFYYTLFEILVNQGYYLAAQTIVLSLHTSKAKLLAKLRTEGIETIDPFYVELKNASEDHIERMNDFSTKFSDFNRSQFGTKARQDELDQHRIRAFKTSYPIPPRILPISDILKSFTVQIKEIDLITNEAEREKRKQKLLDDLNEIEKIQEKAKLQSALNNQFIDQIFFQNLSAVDQGNLIEEWLTRLSIANLETYFKFDGSWNELVNMLNLLATQEKLGDERFVKIYHWLNAAPERMQKLINQVVANPHFLDFFPLYLKHRTVNPVVMVIVATQGAILRVNKSSESAQLALKETQTAHEIDTVLKNLNSEVQACNRSIGITIEKNTLTLQAFEQMVLERRNSHEIIYRAITDINKLIESVKYDLDSAENIAEVKKITSASLTAAGQLLPNNPKQLMRCTAVIQAHADIILLKKNLENCGENIYELAILKTGAVNKLVSLRKILGLDNLLYKQYQTIIKDLTTPFAELIHNSLHAKEKPTAHLLPKLLVMKENIIQSKIKEISANAGSPPGADDFAPIIIDHFKQMILSSRFTDKQLKELLTLSVDSATIIHGFDKISYNAIMTLEAWTRALQELAQENQLRSEVLTQLQTELKSAKTLDEVHDLARNAKVSLLSATTISPLEEEQFQKACELIDTIAKIKIQRLQSNLPSIPGTPKNIETPLPIDSKKAAKNLLVTYLEDHPYLRSAIKYTAFSAAGLLAAKILLPAGIIAAIGKLGVMGVRAILHGAAGYSVAATAASAAAAVGLFKRNKKVAEPNDPLIDEKIFAKIIEVTKETFSKCNEQGNSLPSNRVDAIHAIIHILKTDENDNTLGGMLSKQLKIAFGFAEMSTEELTLQLQALTNSPNVVAHSTSPQA